MKLEVYINCFKDFINILDEAFFTLRGLASFQAL
jgi:hypothetical protein